ncbi:MAG: DNA-methyltransferase [Gemmatimonadales bacterium]
MIDLRLGDALGPDGLAGLADASVASTITDPPFDARTHRAASEAGDWRKGKRAISSALPFAPFGQVQIEAAARELARVTRRWIVVFAAERQIETWAQALEAGGARFIRLGLALRANPRPQMTADRPAPPADWLVIAHGPGERLRWNGGGHPAVWDSPAARFDTGRKTLHPTQKPLHLMRALVSDFTDPGELVLDPFAGSGTTASACAELARRFIGWELSSAFHAAAVARLRGGGYFDTPAAEVASKASTRPAEVSTVELTATGSQASTCDYCGRLLEAGKRRDARYHPSCRRMASRRRRSAA